MYERGSDYVCIDKLKPDCEWVIHEGFATEKLDGTNVMIWVRGETVLAFFRRITPPREQSPSPLDKFGLYEEVNRSDPNSKWIIDALNNTDLSGWPDGDHCCEAIGPKIQGNPLGLASRRCEPLDLWPFIYESFPRTFNEIRSALENLESLCSPGHIAEGVVFHHPDGRRAKIKRRDLFRIKP